MYSRILVSLDGSDTAERVLPYATLLASGLSLPLTLTLVVEPAHPSIGLNLYETTEHRAGHASEYLETVSERLRGEGLDVSCVVAQGDPATMIVAEAEKDAGTLIAMSSHGRSGLARWWLGSVTDKVLHLAANPLLIIRSTQQSGPPDAILERMIVPVDGSELAGQILPHAAYVAKGLGLTIDLARVTPSAAEYYRAMAIGPVDIIPTGGLSYESFAASVDAEARAYLEAISERLQAEGVASVETHLLQGAPAERLIDLAAESPHRLVAMTTHGRSGVGRLVLGSVAERVVRQSGDPVLLIRAAGMTG
jgi:nucleotide-binding universal stress UspA family protein